MKNTKVNLKINVGIEETATDGNQFGEALTKIGQDLLGYRMTLSGEITPEECRMLCWLFMHQLRRLDGRAYRAEQRAARNR